MPYIIVKKDPSGDTYYTEVGKPTKFRSESALLYNINDAIVVCNILEELDENIYKVEEEASLYEQ